MSTVISVRPIIYAQYRKKDGTYPVRMRVIFNRRVKFISTNIIARPEQLTKDLCIKDRILREQVNGLTDKLQDAANSIDTVSLRDMDINDVIEQIVDIAANMDRVFSLDFLTYAMKIADEKPKNSRTNYLCAIHSLCEYVKMEQFDISIITSSMLRGYELFLRNKYGNFARAVSMYPAAIAYIHRRAQSEYNNEELGEINIANPFSHYKCPRQKQAMHRNFDSSLIDTMIDMRECLNGRERFGVDIYLLSFALMGMNSPDLFSCKPPKKGVITYERTKTKGRREDNAEMRVRIEKCVEYIYKEYADEKGEYAFNFHERYSNYKNFGRAVNLGLKDFTDRIKNEKGITLYSARHTFASVAYSIGIDKNTINDCLCHVDPDMRVTDIYVQKDWRVLWKANAKVQSKFKWKSAPVGLVPDVNTP